MRSRLVEAVDPHGSAPYTVAGAARVSSVGTAHEIYGSGLDRAALPRMRVASISKLVTALALHGLADEGALSLDLRLRDILGAGDHRITLRHLVTHRSGLTDLGGYILEPPERLLQILDQAPTKSPHAPGAFFRYCNLGYILLGMAMEHATGTRFDALVARLVLRPAGVMGGFNWVGVPLDDRASHLALTQREGAETRVTIDGPNAAWAADLIWADGQGRDLDDHRLGADALYLSPHAGLRANVLELARLAYFLGTSPLGAAAREEAWAFDGTNGLSGGGLFLRVGHGVSLYGDDPRLPFRLAGHAGHALGFSGGAWWDPSSASGFAYVLTGAADETAGEEDDVFYLPKEAAILRALAEGG